MFLLVGPQHSVFIGVIVLHTFEVIWAVGLVNIRRRWGTAIFGTVYKERSLPERGGFLGPDGDLGHNHWCMCVGVGVGVS